MAHWNRFDICTAYYLFARNYNTGGDIDLIFHRLNKIGFRPGAGFMLHGDMSENALEIYFELVKKLATNMALKRSHKISEWKYSEDTKTWIANCNECGRYVLVEEGEERDYSGEIHGRATTTACQPRPQFLY